MQDRPLLDAPDFLDALRAGDGGAFVTLVHEGNPRPILPRGAEIVGTQ